ncbi:MAG TPA: tetratricopeptide repeat protein [Alphaproteobacteria bacterium]|nr:tetratricopeptide repeat protein [Alphaproteobacteria bacterium]HJP22864.1 tetratricopeptide repeat protein [Alphaproteobacteria bacterium]
MAALPQDFPKATGLNRAERRRQLKEQKKAAKQGGAAGAAALYDEGNRLGSLGQLAAAEAAYRQAIAIRPQFPEALSNLGSVLQATDRLDAAEEDFRQALALLSGNPLILTNLGVVLDGQSRSEEAVSSFRQAIAADTSHLPAYRNLAAALADSGDRAGAIAVLRQLLDREPGEAGTHADLGRLWRQQGEHQSARAALERALELDPGLARAHNELGNLLGEAGDGDGALAAYRRAIEIDPAFDEAHANLLRLAAERGEPSLAHASIQRMLEKNPDFAPAHNELGNALSAQNDLAGATAAYRRAIEIDSNFAGAHNNLGNALKESLRFDEALDAYGRALELLPDDATVLKNLGIAERCADRPFEAIARYREALNVEPEDEQLLSLLAATHLQVGEAERALECYDRILAGTPDDIVALCNRSAPLLMQQDFAAGYAAQEYRWRSIESRALGQTEWAGEALAGRSIRVWSEQGVGDVVLFACCLPELVELVGRAGRVVVEVEARLVALFARSFPDIEVVEQSDPPAASAANAIDYQIAMASLPRWLRPDLAAFPQRQGYLLANDGTRARWQERLKALGQGLKVGILWRSSLISADRWREHSEIAGWGEILRLPGFRFVNLQYGGGDADLADLDADLRSRVETFPDLDLFNDLDGSAALIAGLDLVISPLSTSAWLAGALGIPTWVLSQPGDWRQLGTDGFPWLPSVRMLIKPIGQPWTQVLERVAADLREQADRALV